MIAPQLPGRLACVEHSNEACGRHKKATSDIDSFSRGCVGTLKSCLKSSFCSPLDSEHPADQPLFAFHPVPLSQLPLPANTSPDLTPDSNLSVRTFKVASPGEHFPDHACFVSLESVPLRDICQALTVLPWYHCYTSTSGYCCDNAAPV